LRRAICRRVYKHFMHLHRAMHVMLMTGSLIVLTQPARGLQVRTQLIANTVRARFNL
jgi:hypothetical protein